MYRQDVQLYRPDIIDRSAFKKMAFAMIVLYVAAAWKMGGVPPVIEDMSFLYTPEHPVLCSFGSGNASTKHMIHGEPSFNRKKWVKFLRRQKTDKVKGYLKSYYPRYFQKRRPGRRCVLNERRGLAFDDLTHSLICQDWYLMEVLRTFRELMPDLHIRDQLIPEWIREAEPIDASTSSGDD